MGQNVSENERELIVKGHAQSTALAEMNKYYIARR